jgi:capsule polysaccharide export protein KpsE/RkpR
VEEEMVVIQDEIRLLEMVQIPNFIHHHIIPTLLHNLFAVLVEVVVALGILVVVQRNMEDLV